MNIEKMREEFEKLFGMLMEESQLLAPVWQAAWIASRAAIEVELQPAWHPMSEDPPFPFTGDIFVGGKVVAGAAWCAGYWQAKRGGCVDRKSVSHWKHSNPAVRNPEA